MWGVFILLNNSFTFNELDSTNSIGCADFFRDFICCRFCINVLLKPILRSSDWLAVIHIHGEGRKPSLEWNIHRPVTEKPVNHRLKFLKNLPNKLFLQWNSEWAWQCSRLNSAEAFLCHLSSSDVFPITASCTTYCFQTRRGFRGARRSVLIGRTRPRGGGSN